jgi:hypothetical protein
MYFSKHYEIALFEITGAIQFQTLPLESNVEFDQDVFLLARDKDFSLIYKRVKVQLVDPCEHQHNHYLFIDGSIPEVIIILFFFVLILFNYNCRI